MLSDFIQAAMHEAKYENVEDVGTYYGETPGLLSVWRMRMRSKPVATSCSLS